MLGDAVLYAVRRATSTALENLERKAAWTATSAAFLLCALVSALILAYQFVEPKVGASIAVGLVSAACLFVGLICLWLPSIIERVERRRAKVNAVPVATAATALDGAGSSIDYFGAVRVVGAAFLFGLAAARRLKS